jgi:hypothetical protein
MNAITLHLLQELTEVLLSAEITNQQVSIGSVRRSQRPILFQQIIEQDVNSVPPTFFDYQKRFLS